MVKSKETEVRRKGTDFWNSELAINHHLGKRSVCKYTSLEQPRVPWLCPWRHKRTSMSFHHIQRTGNLGCPFVNIDQKTFLQRQMGPISVCFLRLPYECLFVLRWGIKVNHHTHGWACRWIHWAQVSLKPCQTISVWLLSLYLFLTSGPRRRKCGKRTREHRGNN